MSNLKLIACAAGVIFATIFLTVLSCAIGTLAAHYMNLLLAKLGG